jgi:hypothetical protein
MIDKFVRSVAEATEGIKDGSTVIVAGFAQVGEPRALIEGLIEQGAKHLTVVHNTAGRGREGVARLIGEGRVRKIICRKYVTFLRSGVQDRSAAPWRPRVPRSSRYDLKKGVEAGSGIEPLYTDLQSVAARFPKLSKTPISQFFQWRTAQSRNSVSRMARRHKISIGDNGRHQEPARHQRWRAQPNETSNFNSKARQPRKARRP